MSEDRLQILEEKLAFLEDTVQRLNDALTSQQRQLHELQSGYEVLKHKYAELSSSESGDSAYTDQKPPHY